MNEVITSISMLAVMIGVTGNALGNHAPVLAIGNELSCTGCLTALSLAWRFPAEHRRRTGDLQLAAA